MNAFRKNDFAFLGLSVNDLLDCNLSGGKAILLQSENLYMGLKIKQLEFDLESEKIRSRHFEGLSQIVLLELQKGNWVNSIDRRNRVTTLVAEFQREIEHFEGIKTEMVNCVRKLENLISSINTILQ